MFSNGILEMLSASLHLKAKHHSIGRRSYHEVLYQKKKYHQVTEKKMISWYGFRMSIMRATGIIPPWWSEASLHSH